MRRWIRDCGRDLIKESGTCRCLDLREKKRGISFGWEGLKFIYAAHPISPPRGRYQFDFIYLSTFPLNERLPTSHITCFVTLFGLPPNSNPLSLSQSRSALTIRLISNHSCLLVDAFSPPQILGFIFSTPQSCGETSKIEFG